MDDGQILVHGRTQEILAQSGCASLEQAYIRMLPESKQTHWDDSQLPPFIPDDSLPPAMEAHNLSKRFGDFTAVNKVSFRIRQGEIFGFLGSNGCPDNYDDRDNGPDKDLFHGPDGSGYDRLRDEPGHERGRH